MMGDSIHSRKMSVLVSLKILSFASIQVIFLSPEYVKVEVQVWNFLQVLDLWKSLLLQRI